MKLLIGTEWSTGEGGEEVRNEANYRVRVGRDQRRKKEGRNARKKHRRIEYNNIRVRHTFSLSTTTTQQLLLVMCWVMNMSD